MATPPQFVLVIAVGFEPGEADQVAVGERRQAGKEEGPCGETELAAFQQLACEGSPAILGQLLRAQTFIGQVGGGLDWLAGDGSYLELPVPQYVAQQQREADDDGCQQRVKQDFQ